MTVDNASSKIAACVSDARFHTTQKSFTSNRFWRCQPQNPSVWKVFSHEIKTDPMLDAPGHIILKKNKCFYQNVMIFSTSVIVVDLYSQ